MTKLQAIAAAKQIRQDLDAVLQRMKQHRIQLSIPSLPANAEAADVIEHPADIGETIAQHMLSIRDLESAILRQGMVLKAVGGPNPYPESYNPASPRVDRPTDGITL